MPSYHPDVKAAMDSATRRMDEWSEEARKKAAEARAAHNIGKGFAAGRKKAVAAAPKAPADDPEDRKANARWHTEQAQAAGQRLSSGTSKDPEDDRASQRWHTSQAARHRM